MNEKVATEKKSVTLGLICAGGCGTNNAREVMRTLDPAQHPHLKILVCNTDRPQLDNHFVEKKEDGLDESEAMLQKWLRLKDTQLTILQLGEDGMGAGGKPEEGARVAEKSLRDIEEFIKCVDAVVIIGGGGKGTGSGALPVIAQAAEAQGKSPLAILTMPRFSEGGRRLKKAEATRQKLIEICPTAVVYNQQMPNTAMTYTEVWSEINRSCLLPMLLVLQEIILEVADLNVDLKDWQAILEEGHYIQFGRCDVTEADGNNFELVAERLLNNPYQDTNIMSKAREILLWLHGSTWTVEGHDKIVSCIQSRMEQDIRNEGIEITPGLYQTTKDNMKWVAVLVVAEAPPSDMPDLNKRHVAEKVLTPEVLTKQTVALPPPVPPVSVPVLQMNVLETAYTTQHTNGGSTNKAPLKCLVNGQVMNFHVSGEIAARWNRIFAGTSVKISDINQLREQIEHETGCIPDIPKGLSVLS